MALEFQSPRFQGDALLLDILNDPDTGTKKLQPGSPPDSVMRLQKALFDLTWTMRIVPAIGVESDFVVGQYGPRTQETVLAYKRHYDIHFPPTEVTGFFDGLAGPRTLRKLDGHCVLIDEAIAAIDAKVAELAGAGVAVDASFRTFPLDRTSGAFRLATISGAIGAVLYKRGVGAFEVHGNIFDAYLNSGLGGGPFGFPVSDEHDDGPGFRSSDFERGSMRCDLRTGVVELRGPQPGAAEDVVF